jgi:hypothetical protein
MLRDSWAVMRRTSALWGLGVISALQASVYGLIVVGLIMPMMVLTQVLVSAGAATAAGDSSLAPLQAYLPGIVAWIERWQSLLVGGIVAVVVVWVALGVLDVAATAGLISQASKSAEGRDASVGAGMRDGFGIWWRTIGLLAVAALPGLAYLLGIALFTLFTISIPLSMGQAPDVGAMAAGNMINGVLSSVVSIVAIPLAVLVNLGLRYAVLEGQEWKPALTSAWRLARANFAEVAVMYLLQVGVSLAASVAVTIVLGFVSIVAGIAVATLVAAAHTFSGAAMFVTIIAVLIVTVVGCAYVVAITVWYSTVWTLFWRRLTGRESRGVAPAPMYAPPGYAYPLDTSGHSSGSPGGSHQSPQRPE